MRARSASGAISPIPRTPEAATSRPVVVAVPLRHASNGLSREDAPPDVVEMLRQAEAFVENGGADDTGLCWRAALRHATSMAFPSSFSAAKLDTSVAPRGGGTLSRTFVVWLDMAAFMADRFGDDVEHLGLDDHGLRVKGSMARETERGIHCPDFAPAEAVEKNNARTLGCRTGRSGMAACAAEGVGKDGAILERRRGGRTVGPLLPG